jgi:hypothetical protein
MGVSAGVGASVGSAESGTGEFIGSGMVVAPIVGTSEGTNLGVSVGSAVSETGELVGSGIVVAPIVGTGEGTTVGVSVGAGVDWQAATNDKTASAIMPNNQ